MGLFRAVVERPRVGVLASAPEQIGHVTGNVQAVSQIGKTVGDKYRLIRVLGVGGMGVVYEAQHLVTQRKVALKLLHQWVAESSPAAATRFLREAQAAASIGHPALVDVFDAGQLEDGSLFLVFELLDGEDLENALTDGELRAHDVVAIICDVLDGLAAAHARGFVHRDIKPANVFLSKNHAGERQVKLLDFGISKRDDASKTFSNITAHGSIVGTLEYMSPEQASAQPVDNRSDLWAIGALFHRALAGRPPFIGESQLELVKAILIAPIPSLGDVRPDLPVRLVQIVDRALIRDREKRWPTASAMREALLEVERQTLPPTLPPGYDSSNITPELQPRELSQRDEPTLRAVRPERAIIRRSEAEATEISYVPLIEVEVSEESLPVLVATPAAEVPTLAASPPPAMEETDRGTLIVPDRTVPLVQSEPASKKNSGRYLLATMLIVTVATVVALVTFSDPPQAAQTVEIAPNPPTKAPADMMPPTDIMPSENPVPVRVPVPVLPTDVMPVEETKTAPIQDKREKKRPKKKAFQRRQPSEDPKPEPQPQKKDDGEFFYKSMEDGP